MSSNDNIYIAFSGLIGAGKTTLANALGHEMGLPVFHEPVSENPYLDMFYSDMKTYSFPMQIYLLNERFRQHQEIVWTGKGGISDRSIYEDEIFCRTLVKSGLMSELDHQTYKSIFSSMSNVMRHPTILVHLDISPEECMKRIKQRNRDCEKGITLEYITMLWNEYNQFIKEINRSVPVFRINWEKYSDPEVVATAIRNEIDKINSVKVIDLE